MTNLPVQRNVSTFHLYFSNLASGSFIISFMTGGCKPEKDPAEMSVQERLAIFSKKQTSALIPKAPFGQSVPKKVSMDSYLVLHCQVNSGRICIS